MKRNEPRISIPILLIATGELFLILAIFLHGIHKIAGMYATSFISVAFIIAGIIEIIRKNRRKED